MARHVEHKSRGEVVGFLVTRENIYRNEHITPVFKMIILCNTHDIYYKTIEVFGCVFHPTNFTRGFCYISGIRGGSSLKSDRVL